MHGFAGMVSLPLAMLLVPGTALAQIGYTASFTPNPPGPFTPIGKLSWLNDGKMDEAGANGFGVAMLEGTLTFTFANDWNLSNFTLWNNINRTYGGVTAFALRFYDSGGTLLGSRTLSGVGRSDPPLQVPLAYAGVRKVEMEISDSHTQIEIREIRFDGSRTPAPPPPPPPPPPPSLSTCCPPSATFLLPSMFSSVQANVAGNYHLQFTMNATFDSQMAAYVALLKALDPTVTSVALTANVYDGGAVTGAPLIGGPALQTGAVFWIPPPGPSTNIWPLSSFFTSAADLPPNRWTVVEVGTWIGRRGSFVQSCEMRRFAFDPQVIELRSRGGSRASGFVDYVGPPPRSAAPPPPSR